MGNIVSLKNVIVLNGSPTDLDSSAGQQWVADCCRAGEGLCSDQELMGKYELSPDEFQKISANKTLIRAIKAESERRVRNGVATREAACKHWVKGPAILDSIMSNEHSNPRHKIEAIKELRATATGGSGDGRAADSEKFTIVINLGEDHVERFETTISPKTIEGTTDDE